jgi:hypothetical protein
MQAESRMKVCILGREGRSARGCVAGESGGHWMGLDGQVRPVFISLANDTCSRGKQVNGGSRGVNGSCGWECGQSRSAKWSTVAVHEPRAQHTAPCKLPSFLCHRLELGPLSQRRLHNK